jgi:hypothetical protein
MARANKALLTRQDLIDMSNDGLILLRPGSGIEYSGTAINKALSREEISNFAYVYGNNFDIGGGTFVIQNIGGDGGGSLVGFSYDTVTIQAFKPDPAVNGISPNSGTVTNVYTAVPHDKYRMTNYGTDPRFADYIISPTVDTYSKTAKITNTQESSGPITSTLTIGKSGTTPTGTYSRSSSGSTDISGNVRLGNFVNFTVATTSSWASGGTLFIEVWENGVLHYNKNLFISGSGTGSLSINNYKIQYGISYEFKGKSSMVSEFSGAFSNVTGQRACNLL